MQSTAAELGFLVTATTAFGGIELVEHLVAGMPEHIDGAGGG